MKTKSKFEKLKEGLFSKKLSDLSAIRGRGNSCEQEVIVETGCASCDASVCSDSYESCDYTC